MFDSIRGLVLLLVWLVLIPAATGQNTGNFSNPAQRISDQQPASTARPLHIERIPGNIARIRMSDEPFPSHTKNDSTSVKNPTHTALAIPQQPADSKQPSRIPAGFLMADEPQTAQGSNESVRLANYFDELGLATFFEDMESEQDDILFFPESRPKSVVTDRSDRFEMLPPPAFERDFSTPSPVAEFPRSRPAEQTPARPASTSRPLNQPSRETAAPPPPVFNHGAPPRMPSFQPRVDAGGQPPYQPFTNEQMRSMQPPTSSSANAGSRRQDTAPATQQGYAPHHQIGDSYFEPSSVMTDQSGYGQDNFCNLVCNDLFYASAFLGYNSLDDFQFSSLGNLGNINGKSGAFAGVNLGIHHGPNLRAEYELSYRTNDFETVQNEYAPIPWYGRGLTGEVRAFSGMSNLYWDINNFNFFGVRPYVGAGIGFSRFDQEIRWNGVSVLDPSSTSDSNLAYQFIVGANGNFHNNVDWHIEYRYFNAGDSHVQFNNSLTGSPIHDRLSYTSNAIVAGLKIKF